MGRRGPLPKPTAQKRLEGNPGKRKLPKDEPTPPPMDFVPPPPSWMAPLAQEAWRAIAAELAAAKLLHRLDLTTLELYSVTYAHWRAMVAAIVEEGHTKTFTDKDGRETNSQPTPEATRASAYAEQLNKLCRVLGVGPAHRVGLGVVVTAAGKPTSSDPVAAALAGGNLARATPPPKRAAAKAKPPTKTTKPPTKSTKPRATKRAPAKRPPEQAD